MRIRLLGAAAAICLLVHIVPLWAGAEAKDAPAIIVRMKSISQQLADAEFIAGLADSAEQFKPFKQMYQAKLKGNSLDGIDVARPLGAYASLEKDLADTKLVFLLPIADQKAFLAVLKSHEIPMEEQDGLYTLRVPNGAQNAMAWDLAVREVFKAAFKADIGAMPDPFYLRFADKYAYIGVGKQSKELLNAKKLPAVASLLPANVSTSVSVSLAIDGLSADRKKQVLDLAGVLAEQLKKEKEPEETATKHRLRTAFASEIEAWTKIVVKEAGELTLSFDVDRKKNDLSIALGLDGKPGTKLAQAITDLGGARSVSAGLMGKDSAMAMFMHVAVPQNLRKAWAQYVEEDLQKELLKDAKENRALQEALYKVIKPTLLGAELDIGMNVRGPSKAGLYAGVLAVKVQDGPLVLKTILANVPEKEAKLIERDVAKVGGISIHKITKLENMEKKEDKVKFGDGPVYFAARDDALMMGFGDGALVALKDALASKPAASKLYHLEVAATRFPMMFAMDEKAAEEAARKVFAKYPDADRIRMTLEGGKSLRMSYSMSGTLIAYFQLVSKMKMEK